MSIPSDNELLDAINILNETYKRNIKRFETIDDLSDTVLDPMSIFVHTVFSGVANNDEWFKLEKIRRMDKAFTNKIGLFHEKILSSVDGWHKPSGGFDLLNEGKKVIVEIKNKHNTMNSSSSSSTYEKCYHYYRSNRDWTVYLAQIIPKRGAINEPWTISGRSPNDNIRIIDGATLYEMVTGEPEALKKIYLRLIALLPKLDLNIDESQVKVFLDAYDSCYG